MMQIILDTFNTHHVHGHLGSAVSVHPWVPTGVVVDSGDMLQTYSVLLHTTFFLGLTVRYMTVYFIKILTEWGYSLTAQLNLILVAGIKAVLYCPGFWARNGHWYLLLLGEELETVWWAGDHHWKRTIPVSIVVCPALFSGHGTQGIHETILDQDHENQDHCYPSEQVLSLDCWLHPGFTVHFHTNVDQQSGSTGGQDPLSSTVNVSRWTGHLLMSCFWSINFPRQMGTPHASLTKLE